MADSSASSARPRQSGPARFDRFLDGREFSEGLPRISLLSQERVKSRLRASLSDGRECHLALPRGRPLRPGDVLGGPQGEAAVVEARPEELILARAPDPLSFARAAYHLGNRHASLELSALGELSLAFLPDPVLEGLAQGLGLRLERACRPFLPEAGAYGGHGDMSRGEGGPAESLGLGERP